MTSYKYDSLYRLIEAKETQNSTQTWRQNFAYDRYGNRTGHEKFIGSTQVTLDSTTHPAIDAATNRFQAGQGYVFDKNGNLTTDAEGRTFVFNGDNKQKEVRDASNAVVGQYFYDGEGRRVKKVTDQDTTIFVYSAGKLIAEYSTAPPPQEPTTKWTVTDQLGSPRVLVDSLGQIVARRDFLPFGEEIHTGVGARSTTLDYGSTEDNVRQKFTGYQKDTETSLDFAEARMYENRFGRFTAVDPLLASGKSADPQTFNRYVYVGNNPIARIDPNGTEWIISTVVTLYGVKYIGPTWIDPDEYDGQKLWSEMIYFSRQSNRWIALDPNTGDWSRQPTREAAYWKYGLYTDFEGGYDGLLEGNFGFQGLINDGVQANDLAYLVAYIKTGDSDRALAQFSKISIQNGVGAGIGKYLIGFLGKAVGVEATDNLVARLGSQAIVPKAARSLGIWGETRLAQFLGGGVEKNTVRLATKLGDRVPDFLVEGVAYEAKAGLNVGLTSAIRKQVLKDADLIAKGAIRGAHWHFFQGAQKDLLDYLTQNGIKYTVH